MKRAYIAGRVAQRDRSVREMKDRLKAFGYSLTFDWTEVPSIQPYEANREASVEASRQMIRGAKDADVFILVWDESLYGALVELGVALGASSEKHLKQLYIVGEKERVMIFEMLPEFFTGTLEEVLDHIQTGN